MASASARTAAIAADGQNQGGPQMSDNGQPGSTVLGEITFGTIVNTRPELKGGAKGKKASPLDEATLGTLNLMLEAGGGQSNSVNWKGSNLELRQKLTGPMSSTFAKWAKAQEVKGVIVKLHRNQLAASPNDIDSAKEHNDEEVFVNYYLEVTQAVNAANPQVLVKA